MQQDLLESYASPQFYLQGFRDNPTVKYYRLYTMRKILPDLRNKVVLDLPCATGNQCIDFLKLGARKVIGSDVVQEQLDLMRENFQKLFINPEKYQVHQLDAKQPKVISSELADFAMVMHLLCFADTKEEIKRMSRTIFVNIKKGASVLFLSCCPMTGQREMYEKISSEKVIEYIPPDIQQNKPGFLHGEVDGFSLKRNVWHLSDYIEQIKESGFQNVKTVPMEVDPDYKGNIRFEDYPKVCEYTFVFAEKLSE